MKAKLTFLAIIVMATLLLFSGVTFAETPTEDGGESTEFCTPEELETDRENCPGTWASSEDMTPEHRDTYLDDDESSSDNTQAFIGCDFQTKADWPHRSSNPPGYVSAHGWWIDDSDADDPCPVYADVTVSLYGYWCWIPGIDCAWWTLDTNTERVKADNKPGGSRVNAREWCETNTTTMYLSVVDVDLVGMADWPDVVEVVADVNCRPIDD